MKRILCTTALVLIALSMDYFFQMHGVPIVTLDLILSPLALCIIYFLLSSDFIRGKYINPKTNSLTLAKRIGLILGAAVFSIVGVLIILLGLFDPLELHGGVRGAAHGYTVALLGLVITLFSLQCGYLVYTLKRYCL